MATLLFSIIMILTKELRHEHIREIYDMTVNHSGLTTQVHKYQ
jgi:hypothetical protein